MNYATIKKYDIANGPGVRVSLFVSGCTHKCKACFNEEAWDFNYGEKFTDNTVAEILEAMSPSYIKGLSLLGGEPFEKRNAEVLLPFVKRVKEIFPEKDIWAYSGYTYEELLIDETSKKILECIDVLVDGRFVLELKNPSLAFRGSSNQRIIDTKNSIKKGEVILHPKNKKGLK